jgi:hypothetical protein
MLGRDTQGALAIFEHIDVTMQDNLKWANLLDGVVTSIVVYLKFETLG